MGTNLNGKQIDYAEHGIRNGIVWAWISGISAIGFLMAISWGEIASGVVFLLALVALFSLGMVLKHNAEVLHRQTKEDVAFIHLTTSLSIGLALFSPIIGVWFSLKSAVMALRGKCMQSGGTLKETPPLHCIGKTSFHLGILVIVLTAIAQGAWLLLLRRIYTSLQ